MRVAGAFDLGEEVLRVSDSELGCFYPKTLTLELGWGKTAFLKTGSELEV